MSVSLCTVLHTILTTILGKQPCLMIMVNGPNLASLQRGFKVEGISGRFGESKFLLQKQSVLIVVPCCALVSLAIRISRAEFFTATETSCASYETENSTNFFSYVNLCMNEKGTQIALSANITVHPKY